MASARNRHGSAIPRGGADGYRRPSQSTLSPRTGRYVLPHQLSPEVNGVPTYSTLSGGIGRPVRLIPPVLGRVLAPPQPDWTSAALRPQRGATARSPCRSSSGPSDACGIGSFSPAYGLQSAHYTAVETPVSEAPWGHNIPAVSSA